MKSNRPPFPRKKSWPGAPTFWRKLWATVQKGRNYLDERLSSDESAAEAEAVMEGVLGKAWQLAELREKGHFRQNLALLELAFERYDDRAGEQRIETSHLLELHSGDLPQAITYRPFKAMQHIAEQPSYAQPLMIAEAAIYPGFLNRRVRWEKAAEQAVELTPNHLKMAYAKAMPDFKSALDVFRKQLKHPLAPREATVLLRCANIGQVSDQVVLEDAAGVRIVAANWPERTKSYSNVANLMRAGGMLAKHKPAVLGRLFVHPVSNTIVVQPLAALTEKQHLRLGL